MRRKLGEDSLPAPARADSSFPHSAGKTTALFQHTSASSWLVFVYQADVQDLKRRDGLCICPGTVQSRFFS